MRDHQPIPTLDERQRYTINESADLLRCSRDRVYVKIRAGEIRLIKDGRRSYIPGTEIARLSALPA